MMQKPKIEKETVRVPLEVFLDVCKVVLTGQLGSKIAGINDAIGEVVLELSFTKEKKGQKEAVSNITDIVLEWNQHRYGAEDPEEIALN
ncbi:MAG: hypothetical protein ACHQRM_18170 [Bacteroidia bacterium]